MRRRYRHKVRGSVYTETTRVTLQASTIDPEEGDILVIYQGEDGQLWAREVREFEDGRFELLANDPAPDPLAAAKARGIAEGLEIAAAWHDEGSEYATQKVEQAREKHRPKAVHDWQIEGARHRNAAAAIRALPAVQPETTGWRPIATVPKSSSSIMVHCPERRNTYIVTWRSDFGRPGVPPGWTVFGGSGYPLGEEPSHWKPIGPDPLATLPAAEVGL